jgi:hypothetical protein
MAYTFIDCKVMEKVDPGTVKDEPLHPDAERRLREMSMDPADFAKLPKEATWIPGYISDIVRDVEEATKNLCYQSTGKYSLPNEGLTLTGKNDGYDVKIVGSTSLPRNPPYIGILQGNIIDAAEECIALVKIVIDCDDQVLIKRVRAVFEKYSTSYVERQE